MITHAIMTILTGYLFYILYSLISYLYVLKENINLADCDDMFEKLKGGPFANTIFTADYISRLILKVHLPALILSIAATMAVWIPLMLGYPPTTVVVVVASLIIAFSFCLHIQFDYFPPWVLDWYNMLVATHLQIHLDYVQGELKQAYQALVEVKHGTLVLSDEELVKLQTHALAMSQEALQVSAVIAETQQPPQVQ